MAETKVKSQPSSRALRSEHSDLRLRGRSDSRRSKTQVEGKSKVRKTHAESVSQPKTSNITKRIHAKVFGKDGKVVGDVTLPGEIFGAKVNNELMAQAVRVYLANQRAGAAHTKTRGEVRGSTRKIYRQKGTGRARHGAITAPIFVGGGITFGPRTRDFSLRFPKKMKRLALFSALTLKHQGNQVVVTDGLPLSGKTKEMQRALSGLNLTDKRGKAENVLLVIADTSPSIPRATRNIAGVTLEQAYSINAYEVLKSKHVVFVKDAVEVLKKTFLGGNV